MTSQPRRGVVLYLVLGALATIGSILFLLHASFSTWEKRLHVDTDEVIARHLAHAAVEALAFSAERELDTREGRKTMSLERGSLGEVLLGDKSSITAAFLPGARAASATELLHRLLGQEPFDAIDRLTKPHPGVQLTYRTSAKLEELPKNGLVDQVPKQVTVDLECTVQLRHARRTRTAQLVMQVGSRQAGVLGRFTVAWKGAPATDTNRLSIDKSGAQLLGPKPLVAFNDPTDYSESDPLWKSSAKDVEKALMIPGYTKIADLEKTFSNRSAVYLESRDAQQPVVLQLAAGSTPAGQGFQVYANPGGTWKLERQSVTSAPKKLESYRPVIPGTKLREAVGVEGIVTPFYVGLNNQGPLGADALPGLAADASSYVRPLGTAAHPSAGLVYGFARARLAAVSNLTVDRDDTRKDEDSQRKEAGFTLPVPEVREPYLKRITAASYALELQREKSHDSLQELLFFGSSVLGPGRATNLNLAATDPRGRTVMLQSELAWALIPLMPDWYQYGKLFPVFVDYEKVMSRKVDFAYNGLLRHAAKKPDEALTALMTQSFAPVSAPVDDDMLEGAHWEHTDPLHKVIGSPGFVDTASATAPKAALGELVTSAIENPRWTRFEVTCTGEQLFRDSFIEFKQLHLDGWTVHFTEEDPTKQPPTLALENLKVASLGGGVLDVPVLSLAGGLTNTGNGAQLEPLVVRAGSLTLKDHGPYDGTFIVTGSIANVATREGHTVIRGNLVLAPGAQLNLTQPLVVIRDAATDPIGADANLHYRSKILSMWDRRLVGVNPDAIEANRYRRPEVQQE